MGEFDRAGADEGPVAGGNPACDLGPGLRGQGCSWIGRELEEQRQPGPVPELAHQWEDTPTEKQRLVGREQFGAAADAHLDRERQQRLRCGPAGAAFLAHQRPVEQVELRRSIQPADGRHRRRTQARERGTGELEQQFGIGRRPGLAQPLHCRHQQLPGLVTKRLPIEGGRVEAGADVAQEEAGELADLGVRIEQCLLQERCGLLRRQVRGQQPEPDLAHGRPGISPQLAGELGKPGGRGGQDDDAGGREALHRVRIAQPHPMEFMALRLGQARADAQGEPPRSRIPGFGGNAQFTAALCLLQEGNDLTEDTLLAGALALVEAGDEVGEFEKMTHRARLEAGAECGQGDGSYGIHPVVGAEQEGWELATVGDQRQSMQGGFAQVAVAVAGHEREGCDRPFPDLLARQAAPGANERVFAVGAGRSVAEALVELRPSAERQLAQELRHLPEGSRSGLQGQGRQDAPKLLLPLACEVGAAGVRHGRIQAFEGLANKSRESSSRRHPAVFRSIRARMAAPTAATPLADLVQTLGLQGSRGSFLWGSRHGFPLGITFGDESNQSDALVQLRYATHAFGEGEQPELVFAEPLPQLMNDGWAEVEIRDDLAWLTLLRLGDRLERNEVIPAIDSVIGCLNRLGIQAVETCHYCGGAEGVTLVASKGRVGQICSKCVEEQIGKDVAQLGFKARSLGPLALLAPIVVVLQALLWGGLWGGLGLLLVRWGGDFAFPVYLAALFVIGLAGVAASPAFLFRFISNRGNRRAGVLGGLGALAALPLGEVVNLCVLAGSPLAALALVHRPDLLLQLAFIDASFAVLKLIAIVAFIWFSAGWAKPREIALEL